MARLRYWKVTAEEMLTITYDQEKLINWEIKCLKSDAERFVGVFLYRNGTPYDYESIKGVCLYYNNIEKAEVGRVTAALEKKFGGKEMQKSERIFLKGSKEIYSAAEIGALAIQLEKDLEAKAVISLEFENTTAEQLKDSGLPEAKLLPIPGE
ncbi:MAG: hypothetical protein D9C04_03070 [Nitrosopumilus sp. B06]|nr:MAG: hypothetical protein EB828_00730 [Nitrosopumilus sp. D6]RNJ79994.1 MAG: hypothetical protein D9C04_03070 [Nitrosopumilus sp. B06]